MKQALILFTRIPVPGKTKTRLMPYFSPKQCAKLHTCFLKDISEQCRKVKADCFVCYAPENGDVKELQDILGKQNRYFPQTGESLGRGCITVWNMFWGWDMTFAFSWGQIFQKSAARIWKRLFRY